jgi:hypothetical protein
MKISSKLAPNSVLERMPDIPTQYIKDEIVMMNEATNRYYALNAVSSEVWSLLERPMTISDLCDELRGSFDVDAERCLGEVLHLVQKMIDEELVQIIDP